MGNNYNYTGNTRMNAVNELYDLFQTLSSKIYIERVNVLEAKNFPAVSIFYNQMELIPKTQDYLLYQQNNDISIACAVKATKDYHQMIVALVQSVISMIINAQQWKQKYKFLGKFNVKYGHDRAGETNFATAIIDFNVSEDVQSDMAYFINLPDLTSINNEISFGYITENENENTVAGYIVPNESDFERADREDHQPEIVETEHTFGKTHVLNINIPT